ncbi:hypothetical protein GLOIN_2v1632366 [Rhizophagus irregularis DAOM 181602=DAOM 197198]|uniref:Uncharacterized protein n=1 Tax=Rhizophagus irregularis (strain DAOM 181602 / DAOM 197198 / MUCL 43194) TaxID=747089 RepID=A0A2P4PTY4_RHIID|nr:hypothetical protein GLOIN_2v1632366 [Rhizophagus irregularis DAOM 181602=DAOM 197198]POG68844.1 hypothetical protein GLOIN_2v1632366 [Rhizophagus irregularis DAOM 181602=DAOM 197198]GET66954.1 hypothetical protein GLOIN_2v1632366 [Rhizophagus irregularis DAOM 181602=DAOM 197198]|eukprot:XP_025175710.1 hypothetical protein GLOIN_2v1632366 [Rhizophagus irregularis DAOM 181602=DAOM 197198]
MINRLSISLDIKLSIVNYFIQILYINLKIAYFYQKFSNKICISTSASFIPLSEAFLYQLIAFSILILVPTP